MDPKRELGDMSQVSGEQELVLKIQNAANASLDRERKLGEPRRLLRIFLGYHEKKKDALKLAEEFEEADIFIPEARAWDDVDLQYFRDVSEGIMTPDEVDEEAVLNGFAFAQLEMIHDSKKPIAIIDVPFNFPLGREDSEGFDELTTFATFEGTLDSIRAKLEEAAIRETDREVYMLSQLQPKIQEVLKDNPMLGEKEEIKILIFLGSEHDRVFSALQRSGQDVVVVSDTASHVFSFKAEGIRKYMYGTKNKVKVDNLLAGRIFLEGIFNKNFGGLLQKNMDSSEEIVRLGRDIISRFDSDEILKIFVLVRQGELSQNRFRAILKEKKLDHLLPEPESPQPANT